MIIRGAYYHVDGYVNTDVALVSLLVLRRIACSDETCFPQKHPVFVILCHKSGVFRTLSEVARKFLHVNTLYKQQLLYTDVSCAQISTCQHSI